VPYTVTVSFDRFIENISLTGDQGTTARTRRDRIVELLSDGFVISEAFPTGSLVRGTGLKGKSDVDVIVALHYGQHIKGKTPRRVLESVREHLSQYRAQLTKKNGQAVTLYFDTWPNVDIVPATQVTTASGAVSHYEIPDMNRGIWLESNPKLHDGPMRQLSTQARQRIRMIKTWNEAHSAYLQSFHIDVMALATAAPTNDWPWDVFKSFEAAAAMIDGPLYHPTGASGRVDDYLNAVDRANVKTRLERARDLARDAWYAVYPPNDNQAEAIRIYRIIFGERFPAYG
jgi:hypothetical protein